MTTETSAEYHRNKEVFEEAKVGLSAVVTRRRRFELGMVQASEKKK